MVFSCLYTVCIFNLHWSKVKRGGEEGNLLNLLPDYPLLLVDKFSFELHLILFCLLKNPNIDYSVSLIFSTLPSQMYCPYYQTHCFYWIACFMSQKCWEFGCNVSGHYVFYSGSGSVINSTQKLQVLSLRVETGHFLGPSGENGSDGKSQTFFLFFLCTAWNPLFLFYFCWLEYRWWERHGIILTSQIITLHTFLHRCWT